MQEVVHGQAGQVDELHLPLVAAECLPRLRDPVRIRLRLARNDDDAPGARMEPQGHLQRRLQVHPHRDADETGAEPPSLHLPLLDGAEDDGDVREHFVAILQHEIQRGSERGDDDVDLPAGILLAEKLRQPPLVAVVGEARRVEVFVIDLDRRSGRGLERRTEALIEEDDPRLSVTRRVEHHDPPGARRIGGRGTGDEAQERGRPDWRRDARSHAIHPVPPLDRRFSCHPLTRKEEASLLKAYPSSFVRRTSWSLSTPQEIRPWPKARSASKPPFEPVHDDQWRIPDILWERIESLLPPRPPHRFGGHNPRVDDHGQLRTSNLL